MKTPFTTRRLGVILASGLLLAVNPEARYKWTKQLTKDEAEKINLEAVLGGTDHWKPDAN